MSARNETISACLAILDRNPAPAPANALSAAERRKLISDGSILRVGSQVTSVAAMVKKPIPAPSESPVNYGKCIDVAREFESIPRIHGEMSMLAKLRGVSPSGLSAALKRLRKLRQRSAA